MTQSILIVDDDADLRELIGFVLQREGYHVRHADGGEAALRALEAWQPELVLLDVMMPDLDGIEVCQRLRQAPQLAHMPIVMLTARVEPFDRAAALQAGADDFITKPFNTKDLLTRVRAALARQAPLEPEASLLTEIAHGTLALLQADWVWILAADKSETCLRTAALFSSQGEEVGRALRADIGAGESSSVSLSGGAHFLARAFRTGQRLEGLSASQIASLPGGNRLANILERQPGQLLYVSPLQLGGTRVGLIVVAGPERPSPEYQQRMTVLAHQAAMAIDYTRLVTGLARRGEQLAALHHASERMVADLDAESVPATVLREAVRVLGAQAGSILRFNPETNDLVFQAAVGPSAESVIGLGVPPGEGLGGWVVRHGQSVCVNHVETDPRFYPGVDNVTGLRTSSLVAAPLASQETVIGVIEVINKSNGDFDEEDQRLLESLTRLASIAMENARLYTELAETLARLERSQAQLVQAEKLAATGRLAASVAHEINNPVQGVRNCLHLARQTALADDERANYLDLALREVDRLSGLVQRSLEFYRPSTGGREPVSLAAILDRALALAEPRLSQSAVEVVLRFAPGLPNVLVVPDQIIQVCLNLALNAADVMPAGGTLTVHGQAAPDGRWVEAQFVDTGPGLSPEIQARLFEPFFTTKPTGTGLGLAVSREIVTRHAGRLTAENRPGGGAVFTLRLPRPIDDH